jgi:hypothetical protein
MSPGNGVEAQACHGLRGLFALGLAAAYQANRRRRGTLECFELK